MLRITRVASESATTLKVEGRIVGEWVGELRRACEPLLRRPGLLRLDLGGVTFADAEGLAELRAVIARHVEIVGCSLFLSELLARTP